jgi:hypothetical protein
VCEREKGERKMGKGGGRRPRMDNYKATHTHLLDDIGGPFDHEGHPSP